MSQRRMQKVQSLVLQRALWFVGVWVIFGIYFGTNLDVGLDWVSKTSLSPMCAFP